MMSVSAALAAPARPLRPALLDAFRDLFNWMSRNSRGAQLAAEVERLEALSDAELAGLGLRRDRIVHRVFATSYGL
jgi:hypothetical protein